MSRSEVNWANRLPDRDWSVYEPVLRGAQQRRLRFAVGGGFAFSTYAERWRDTKDVDLYIRRDDLPAFRALLDDLGLADYHHVEPYDRAWIYRGHDQGLIVDLIWAMANHHVLVDDDWLTRGPLINVRGLSIRLIPPEELIWAKLFVVQRDRCDWPDILNVLYCQAESLDWARLIERIGGDAALLGGLLSTFRWLCPAQAAKTPGWVWTRLGLRTRTGGGARGGCRPDLLDRRDWFGPEGESGRD